MELKVDAVIIGSGPGGEGAAMQLAKAGKQVVVVEKFHEIGGACTHRGTIPSKALRFAINQMTEANRNPFIKELGVHINPTFQQLRQTAGAVIERQASLRRGFYQRNGIEVIHGHARLDGPNRVLVGSEIVIQTQYVVIATGSRPYRPEDVDFNHPRVFDSDTILGLEEKPRTMTIYGAGVIGCEYASMFRNLDVKINLVNSRGRLLDFLDDEISDALSYHMREQGVVIRHNEAHERIEPLDDEVRVHLKSGKCLKSDIVFWAAGRTGNSDRLGLETVGLDPDSRGYLAVNECFQTDVPSIFAVGDVIGFPSLASAAYTQGRAAANKILNNETDFCLLAKEIPSGIYTTPEISSFGKTERELTEQKVPYEVGIAHFKHLAWAQITGQTVGMLKILFSPDDLRILGVHCFGYNAAEIIHIGQAIMSQEGPGNTLRYFMNSTFNYPTMAEAYRVAALNGYNRLA